jgi:hypothetical protein
MGNADHRRLGHGGMAYRGFSTVALLIHLPPNLITSLERSTISTVPSGNSRATSPIYSQPSVVGASCLR